MTDDIFLQELKTDWRRQEIEIDQLRHRLRRRRWAPHVVFALELFGAAAAFAVGVWYFWVALTTKDFLFLLSAVVMIAAIPALTVAGIIARRGSLHWEDETPESVVRVGLRRVDASLKAIRIGRWGVMVIAGFVAVLWIATAAGLIQAATFVPFYTLAATAICAPYLGYLVFRERRLIKERAAYTILLQDLQRADREAET